MSTQKGGLYPGMILGFLLGVAVSLGVGLYVTKAPIPFIDKVPQRNTQSDAAEAERNRTWNPNAQLQGGTAARPAPPAPAPVAPAEPLSQPSPYVPETGAPPAARAPAEPATPGVATARPADRAAAGSTRDPAAILSGNAVPANASATPAAAVAPAVAGAYYVQTGAFAKMQDAERQQAALVMQGLNARIVPHDQSGRLVYRVRIGPIDSREDADLASARARASGVVDETRLVGASR